MSTDPNIEKRIKRHLWGKRRSFFAITPPGTEKLCREALSALAPCEPDIAASRGGVTFGGRMDAAYAANLHLRTANRILMRIDSFQATHFRQLDKQSAEFPWELFLDPRAAFKFHVTAKHSRLFHTGAVADCISKRLNERLGRAAAVSGQAGDQIRLPQQIFVRAADDRFVVSLDSSGDLLYKRGLKTRGGRAPIRETIAAAILAAAGYDGRVPLVDPMCGSGTFSLEAALIAGRIPAGWYRRFAFMDWPCFRPTRWDHIRREARAAIAPLTKPRIMASDVDANSCRLLEKIIRENDLSGGIAVAEKDFFDLSPRDIGTSLQTRQKGLIVINPPYGCRLESKAGSERLFVDICQKLKMDFGGWKTALIVPDRRLARKVPFKATARNLIHGGMNLPLMIGVVA